MLKMDLVYIIRHKLYTEGKSQRAVAKELGLSRNTIRKYAKQSMPSGEGKREGRRRARVLEEVSGRMDELLEEWEGRTTRKQRITGTLLHRRLLEEGYEVGITTVRKYVQEKKREKAEVYIPLVHRCADEAQVDFFEVVVEVKQQRIRVWMFVMRLMFSGHDFVSFYEHCDQVSFLDGHVHAFENFGGVPSRCVYDNLKAAVSKVMFPERKLTERFHGLASHYLFEPCFTRPYTGHDKGGVESRGKGIRLQYLTPIPQAESLAQLGTKVMEEIEKDSRSKRDKEGTTVWDKFEQEKKALRELPQTRYESAKLVVVSVNSQALVRVEGGEYSVPSHWKYLEAMAYVGPSEIRFVCRNESVTRERKERNIKYMDYQEELSRKPQALRQVAPELLTELPEVYGKMWNLLAESHGELEAARILSKLLGAMEKHGHREVEAALEQAIGAEQKHLLGLARFLREPKPERVEVPEKLAHIEVEQAKASDYDHLLMGSKT